MITVLKPEKVASMDAEYYTRLYRRHVQGALVRSGASLFMWIAAWVSLLFGAIQVIHNLLSNAAKFTPDNGFIMLTARQIFDGRKQIPGLSTYATSDLQISIEDSGVGIKKKDLEKIFEPFKQLESSINSQSQGTGLGLPLTKSLVELHGGKIWAESEGEGKGTIFNIVIPI